MKTKDYAIVAAIALAAALGVTWANNRGMLSFLIPEATMPPAPPANVEG